MFFRIIGIAWMMLGIWWMMRPQGLKKRFRKKIKRARRRFLFSLIIIAAGLFLSAARYTHGILAVIFLLIGIGSIIKALFFLTSKAGDKLIDWWLERPLWMWRAWAGTFALIGILFYRIG